MYKVRPVWSGASVYGAWRAAVREPREPSRNAFSMVVRSRRVRGAADRRCCSSSSGASKGSHSLTRRGSSPCSCKARRAAKSSSVELSCTDVMPQVTASASTRRRSRMRCSSEAGGTCRSTRSRAARSRRMPVGSPALSRSIAEPAGAVVHRDTPPSARAREFATDMWTSVRAKTAGCPPVAESRSSREGSRLSPSASLQRVSSQPPPVIQAPGSACADASTMRARASASERVPDRSTSRRSRAPSPRCRCASLKPGMANAPPRSTRSSGSPPPATITPSSTRSEVTKRGAGEWRSSPVSMRP